MSAPRVHSKIFWPSHCLTSPSGYIIGWNIRGFIGCVATIVPGVELQRVQAVLRELADDQDLRRQSPAGPPIVLGQWLADGAEDGGGGSASAALDESLGAASPGPADVAQHNDESIWFTIERDARSRCPRLREIFCYGYRYHTTSHVIFYTQPTPRHFFSVQPLNPDPSAYPVTPPGVSPEEQTMATELEESLRQINSSAIVEQLIKDALASRLRRPAAPGGADDSNGAPNDAPPARDASPAGPRPRPQKRSLFETMLTLHLRCFYWLLWLLEYEIPMYGKLKDLTSIGLQLHRKLSLPDQWRQQRQLIQTRHWNYTSTRSVYVSFRNSMLLAFNDLVMGIVAGSMLWAYSAEMLTFMRANNFVRYLNDYVLRSQIDWLMGWPAGFKLNENLDQFLGKVFLFYIDGWQWVTDYLAALDPLILNALAVLCFVGGISILLAALLDMISFVTFHVAGFYTASERVFRLQLNVLSSLWKLFRGKKYNPLKNRIDSCDYDMDQLLLGTLFFTLIFFLLPTTAIYFLFFGLVRLIITCLKCSIFLLLQLINHFFLYHFWVFVTDRSFMPGGVRFDVITDPHGGWLGRLTAGVGRPAAPFYRRLGEYLRSLWRRGGGEKPRAPTPPTSPMLLSPNISGGPGGAGRRGHSRGSSLSVRNKPPEPTYLILHNRPLPLGALLAAMMRMVLRAPFESIY